jgi:phosphoribosyl-ATP pyrophosphohydrolase
MTQNSNVLDQLYSVIQNRKGDNPETSYTAKLLSQGMPKIAQKVGEEAVEVITAALVENENKVIKESADLLYHLLVLWAQKGVTPENVWNELRCREGASGVLEKISRQKD